MAIYVKCPLNNLKYSLKKYIQKNKKNIKYPKVIKEFKIPIDFYGGSYSVIEGLSYKVIFNDGLADPQIVYDELESGIIVKGAESSSSAKIPLLCIDKSYKSYFDIE
ncbi:hypothetical protein ACJDU8_21355 [Clostridium sp. WILCCON 0269]|uniref:Uncharacterized protein n=1 Tax=Candidatus Clostridium eludens TaxID=3381663 RepID=A0ABW8SRY6_9CLOT